MRVENSLCVIYEERLLSAHPPWGSVCLPHVTPRLFTIISPFLCFLFSHCLISALILFLPLECGHNSLLPPFLCAPSLYL